MNLTLARGVFDDLDDGLSRCRGHHFRIHAIALMPTVMTVTDDATAPSHVGTLMAEDYGRGELAAGGHSDWLPVGSSFHGSRRASSSGNSVWSTQNSLLHGSRMTQKAKPRSYW